MDSLLSHIDGVNIRSVGMAPFFIEENGFSLPHASQIVLKKIRMFLEVPENRQKIDKIIFIITHPRHFPIFAKLMYLFFPIEGMVFDDLTVSDLDNLEEEEESYSDDDDEQDSDYDDEMLPPAYYSDQSSIFAILHNATSEPEDMPGVFFPQKKEITIPPPQMKIAPH